MAKIEYPKMIYKDGKFGDDHIIVKNEDELKAAETDGYLKLGDEKYPITFPSDETKKPAKKAKKSKKE